MMDRHQERILNAIKELGEALVLINHSLERVMTTIAETRVICLPQEPPKAETLFDHRPIGQIILEQEREKMIRVLDKYGIEVSDRCYAVGKICRTTDKKTGKVVEVLQAPSYCTSVESAIKSLRKRLHMEGLKSFDGTLDEAVKCVQEMDGRFNKEMEKIKF